MDQSYLNYGYKPVYHQLTSNQLSPNQHQFTIFPPQRTPENDIHNQTVPVMSTSYSPPADINVKTEAPEYQQQQQQIQYQTENYPSMSNYQNPPTVPYQNGHSSYIPSIFSPHQFQPVWHRNDNNNFPYPSQVVPQYPPSTSYHPQPYDPRYIIRPQPMSYQVRYIKPQENIQHQFSCVDCNKSFMSATNLKRHLTTKVHFSKAVPKSAENFEVRLLDVQAQSSSTSITDLSEAEVVLIDNIDKELSSIEPTCWTSMKMEPLPIVSSSTPSLSSPDIVEEFRCLVCKKTFSKRCYFTQHNRTAHVGHKPFKCSKCGKKYQTRELLDVHLMKHDGEKPFKCEMCTKSFNHKTDLKRHMILHTAEKPHVCQQCSKGFVRKDHLQKHLESHMRKMEKLKRVFTGSTRN